MKIFAIGLLCALTGAAQLIDAGSATDKNFQGGAVWNQSTPGYEPLGDAPYTDLRYGANFSYKVPVSNGFYRVRVYMMENRSSNIAAGQRIFTVSVNGQTTAPIDLFATVGSKKPYTIDLFAVSNSGTITVVLSATKGNAVVSALEVAPLALTDLGTGAIEGDSVRVKGGKYLDVYVETNAEWKKAHGMASIEPRSVPMNAVLANRFGYAGPMVAYIGNDSVVRSAVMANGTVSVELGPDMPSVVAFGFPAMRFSERLTWTVAERWIFTTRPNPANSLSVTKNGNRLMQGEYALSWSVPDQLPDALIIPGTLPNDIILVDYVAGGIPAVPGAAAVDRGFEWLAANAQTSVVK